MGDRSQTKKTRKKRKMLDDAKKQSVRGGLLFIWTLIMASLATAAYVELDDLNQDPTFPTLTWIAVLQAIFVNLLSLRPKMSSSAGNNAVLAMMFSGIYIGQVAPNYVQDVFPFGQWDDGKAFRDPWMKYQVTAMVFAGFAIVEGFVINAALLGKLKCTA